MDSMDSRIPPFIARPVREFRCRLSERFGPRLIDVRLYGSWARGAPSVGSDVDVAVLIDHCTWDDMREVARIEARIIVESGLPISVQVIDSQEFKFLVDREVGFALDVLREGIPA